MSKPINRRRAKQLKRRVANKRPAAPQRQADITEALQLQLAGKLDQARDLYGRILGHDPGNADAWHLLGMTLFAAGELSEALSCLDRANTIIPDHPDVLANMGVVYRALGESNRAKTVLERAVSRNPRSLAARNNLGTVLLERSDLDGAAAQFQAVLDVDRHFENAAMNLGNVWQQQGRLKDAEALYREVLNCEPSHAMCLINLGETLRVQGKWSEALETLELALRNSPHSVSARLSYARTLVSLRRHQEAIAAFTRLTIERPELSKPYHYLGKALIAAGDLPMGAKIIAQAIAIDDRDVHAFCSLGSAYLEMGLSTEAANCYRKALAIEPTMWEAHSALLFVMSGDASVTPLQVFDEHRKWGTMHGRVGLLPIRPAVGPSSRRLRVGYVSPDFRKHAVASFFLPVLQSHRSEEVETFCYGEIAAPDEVTELIQSHADHWKFTNGLSDLQVAQLIHSDNIDVLVDLAGHTTGSRLKSFAYRPAPVQVTWLGYPNTTGLEAMDYRLSCETQNPESEPTYHTEELIRLPFGSVCFTPPSHAPEVSPAPCFENGHITFGSLHRPFKVTPQVRALWAEVLIVNPHSRLILFNTRFTDASSAVISEDLVSRGINANRLEIRNTYDGASYLEVYREIDIGLDTTPWAGGTTTLEALWMGVPVVGFYGDCRSARSTAAILKHVGLGELIGDSTQQYVQRATELSQDLDRIQRYRIDLRKKLTETICNAPRFTAQLELALREIWQRKLQSASES